MKKTTLICTALLATLVFSCKKENNELPSINIACVEARMEDWITKPHASRIIQVDSQAGQYFWFQDDLTDSGEPIYDENCTVVCFRDFKTGTPTPCILPADWETAPRKEIWSK